jgi:S-adenosylmethionine:tRNA ribosyltransferase-isomerase
MKLSQFIYELPKESIAKYPTENRDESKLMVMHKKTGDIEHKIFKDIINYFKPEEVFPARLKGIKEKTGAQIEVFLLRELNRKQRLWDVLVSPARKIRIGNKLYFGDSETLVAEVIDNTTSRGRTLRFLFDGEYEEFKKTLTDLGETPLPIFIGRPVEPEDKERYQTVFAEHEGAVAAPTAGMHFSKILLKKFEIKGIKCAYITLHVGLGSFRNINVEDLTKHKMDNEQINIDDETADMINYAKERERSICAVGTTVIRTMESVTTVTGIVKPFSGWTNKFIFPPYDFMVPNAMVTNFHLPKSIPLMTATAFGGYKNTMNAYKVALKHGYKFGSYGDAMLMI